MIFFLKLKNEANLFFSLKLKNEANAILFFVTFLTHIDGTQKVDPEILIYLREKTNEALAARIKMIKSQLPIHHTQLRWVYQDAGMLTKDLQCGVENLQSMKKATTNNKDMNNRSIDINGPNLAVLICRIACAELEKRHPSMARQHALIRTALRGLNCSVCALFFFFLLNLFHQCW